MNLPVERRREWIRSRREQRKLMRRARLRRQMLRYALLILLMFTATSGFYYLPWSIANAREQIVVRGNKVVSDEQVRQALESALGRPIYRLNPHELESDVKSLDVVQQAFVRRYCLPRPKLVVEILEEFPWASYATDPDCQPKWVIAESGRKVLISEFPKVIQPPLKIYGQSSRAFTSKEVSQWANWISYIEKQTQCPVESVDMRNPQEVKVIAGDLCLKLGSPDSSLTRRLARLASVLSVIDPMRDKLEFIDLGLDSNIPLKLARKAGTQHSLGQLPTPRSQL
ncbi:MAG: hypothetical protein C5B53_13450 [Candidatus Melainabacteria bacterium]|nr:MAG: hypothetical protein C5B53_13450 [Candidatus Melainabacteria bacterium]